MPIPKLTEEQKNYWHPLKGAWSRFKSSWENNQNPIKAVLDQGLGYIIPGISGINLIYDTNRAYNNLTSTSGVSKTINHIKKGEYLNAAKSATGDFIDASQVISAGSIPFNRLKRLPQIEDRIEGAKDLISYVKNPSNPYNNISSNFPKHEKYGKMWGVPEKDELILAANITKDNPNTLNTHFNKNTKIMAAKLIDKMPANSYIGDAMLSPNNQINTNYTYGQRAINSYNKKGFFSAAKELVKNPPNSSPYNYSSDSYIPLIKRAYKYPDKFKLSYITSEYQPFNNQGLYGTLTNNLKQTEDIKQQLNIINESIEKANPNARKAMIKNGEIVLPHPMLFKKN